MFSDLSLTHYNLESLTALFIIILSRITALILSSPGLGETTSPIIVRAGIALTTTFLILPLLRNQLLPAVALATHTPFMVFAIILGEILYGVFIGTLARLMALAFAIAMQIIGLFTGLASVIQADPELGASSTAISHMAASYIPVIILSTGLYILPLTAIIGSYTVFPPGSMPLIGDMTHNIIKVISESFLLSLQLSTPFILLGTLWPALLGVLNRLLPTIQVYSIAMPAQLLGGVLLLALLIQVMSNLWQEHLADFLFTLPGLNHLP